MADLGELLQLGGLAALGGAGPAGRQTAGTLIQGRQQAQAERQQAQAEAQQLRDANAQKAAELRLKTISTALQNPDFVGKTDPKEVEALRGLGAQTLQQLGQSPEESIQLAKSWVPKADTATGASSTLSKPGTVTFDGKTRPVAFDNKGGLIFTDDKTQVPASAMQSYKSLTPPASSTTTVNVNNMTTATKNALEKQIVDTSNTVSQLNSIRKAYNADFLTLSGKLKGAGLDLAEKFGATLSPGQKQYQKDITDFTVQSLSSLNDYIHQITGAQLSVFEADRIRKGYPDAGEGVFGGMGPTKFKQALDTTISKLSLANARAQIMRERGLSYDFGANPNKEGPITLDETRQIINQKGEEVYAGLLATGNYSEDQAHRLAAEQVQRQYGMIQ